MYHPLLKMLRPLLVALLLACGLAASCDKLPKNGKLDGRWQMLDLYSRSTPSAPTHDLHAPKKADGIYWDVQLDLINIHSQGGHLNGHTDDAVARFAYNDNRLAITATYIHYRDRDSLLTAETTALVSFGIRSNTADFRIARLSGSQLILVNASDSLVFRKF